MSGFGTVIVTISGLHFCGVRCLRSREALRGMCGEKGDVMEEVVYRKLGADKVLGRVFGEECGVGRIMWGGKVCVYV